MLLLLALARNIRILVLIRASNRLLDVVLSGILQRPIHETLVEQNRLDRVARLVSIVRKLLLLNQLEVGNREELLDFVVLHVDQRCACDGAHSVRSWHIWHFWEVVGSLEVS